MDFSFYVNKIDRKLGKWDDWLYLTPKLRYRRLKGINIYKFMTLKKDVKTYIVFYFLQIIQILS